MGTEIFPQSIIKDTVYHGTNHHFKDFDLKKRGSNTEWNNTVHGFFFIANQERAKMFGTRIIPCKINIINPVELNITAIFTNVKQASTLWEIASGNVLPNDKALAKMDKEIGLGEIDEFRDMLNTEEANRIMRKNGHDGIISHFGAGEMEYVVFNTNQIYQLENNLDIRTATSPRKKNKPMDFGIGF